MVTLTNKSLSKHFVRAVCFPCGLARQYRVQYLCNGGRDWQKFATYEQADKAAACVEELNSNGYTARVVHHRSVPIGG